MTSSWRAATLMTGFSLEIRGPSTSMMPTHPSSCVSWRIPALQESNLWVFIKKIKKKYTPVGLEVINTDLYSQINKFNPMGDVIGTGMGEFFFFLSSKAPFINLIDLLHNLIKPTQWIEVKVCHFKLLNAYSQVWRRWCGTETSRWSVSSPKGRRNLLPLQAV